MALAYESNTDLAFNTETMKVCANKYKEIAYELRNIASDLDKCLITLKESGWTTPAGTAFCKMIDTNWKENIEKYAALLDTLDEILNKSAEEYNSLVTDYIDKLKF